MDRLENELIKDIGEERYNHTLRVVDTAIKLARKQDIDLEKVKKAAILHDCAKFPGQINWLKMARDFDIILDNYMEYNQDLIHAPLGAKIAEVKYKIEDKEVLDAIYYHTTGRENMTLLDKIIYIADYIEPGRKFPGVDEIRKETFAHLDRGILLALDNTIKFLVDRNKLIHPNTLKARNFLLMDLNPKIKEDIFL